MAPKGAGGGTGACTGAATLPGPLIALAGESVGGLLPATRASGAGSRPAAMPAAIWLSLPPLTAMGATRMALSMPSRAGKSIAAGSVPAAWAAAFMGDRSITIGSFSKKSGMSPKRAFSSLASSTRSADFSSSATRGRLALLISKVAGEMEALDEDAAVMGRGAGWLWVSNNRLLELSAK